mmetsp:Transcript_10868/g.26668  ORF Transcript_10868/g.26668 Transcript_10868/m.26668 type:complete len:246 (-) Transcript_10868:676-1413(-)
MWIRSSSLRHRTRHAAASRCVRSRTSSMSHSTADDHADVSIWNDCSSPSYRRSPPDTPVPLSYTPAHQRGARPKAGPRAKLASHHAAKKHVARRGQGRRVHRASDVLRHRSHAARRPPRRGGCRSCARHALGGAGGHAHSRWRRGVRVLLGGGCQVNYGRLMGMGRGGRRGTADRTDTPHRRDARRAAIDAGGRGSDASDSSTKRVLGIRRARGSTRIARQGLRVYAAVPRVWSHHAAAAARLRD